MNKSKLNLKNLLILMAIFSAFALQARQTPGQQSSNEDSKLVTVKQSVLNDCSKALDELEIYDKLIESKETEIRLLRERVEMEREKSQLLLQIADSRKNEADSYREANNALKEAIAAKETIIENKDKEIEILKKKKPSVFKRILDVAAGVGIGIILK